MASEIVSRVLALLGTLSRVMLWPSGLDFPYEFIHWTAKYCRELYSGAIIRDILWHALTAQDDGY